MMAEAVRITLEYFLQNSIVRVFFSVEVKKIGGVGGLYLSSHQRDDAGQNEWRKATENYDITQIYSFFSKHIQNSPLNGFNTQSTV